MKNLDKGQVINSEGNIIDIPINYNLLKPVWDATACRWIEGISEEELFKVKLDKLNLPIYYDMMDEETKNDYIKYIKELEILKNKILKLKNDNYNNYVDSLISGIKISEKTSETFENPIPSERLKSFVKKYL